MSEASGAGAGEAPLGTRTVPEAARSPLAVSALLLAAGLVGLVFGQPWLLPSLGPTAFLQAEQPGQPSSRFFI